MKIFATTPISFGTKDGVLQVAEGDPFDADKATALLLIAAGTATAEAPKAPAETEAPGA